MYSTCKNEHLAFVAEKKTAVICGMSCSELQLKTDEEQKFPVER